MQIFKHVTANSVFLEPFDFKRELSMEAYLVENESVLSLDKDIYMDVKVVCDEVTLPNARKRGSGDGRIDILTYYGESDTLGLIELKKGEISESDEKQLLDYLNKKDKILKHNSLKDLIDSPSECKWMGILVGSSISEGLRRKILDGYKLKLQDKSEIPLAALVVKRFRGREGQIFVTTDTYFKNTESKRDYTKYKFNSNILFKNGLVLEVLHSHAERYPEKTYAEFKKDFPDNIHDKNYGVFKSLRELSELKESYQSRFFTKPEEVIDLKDVTIAVCNQWGGKPHKKFVKHSIEKLGYKIEEA